MATWVAEQLGGVEPEIMVSTCCIYQKVLERTGLTIR